MLNTKGKLIFPTSEGKKDGHMLRKLHYLAKRAGLNLANFGLHKFRKTCATLSARAGARRQDDSAQAGSQRSDHHARLSGRGESPVGGKQEDGE